MAYKSKKKSPKKMKMGGDYLEPNKELTFGGMKKGKYQAAGLKRPGAGRRTTEEEARSGKPRSENAARAKANNSSNMKRVLPPSVNSRTSTAKSILDQDEFRSAKGAAASSNKASNIAKVAGAKKATDETVANVVNPKPKNLEKAPIKGPKKAERDDKTERTIKKSNMSTVKVKAPSKIKSSAPSPTLKTKEAPKSKKEARINKRAERVTARKAKAEAPTRLERKEARIDRRTDRVLKRKDKKAGIKAAKARLKAARRLEPGGLKPVPSDNKGLPNLPKKVRNKMGYLKRGGKR